MANSSTLHALSYKYVNTFMQLIIMIIEHSWDNAEENEKRTEEENSRREKKTNCKARSRMENFVEYVLPIPLN